MPLMSSEVRIKKLRGSGGFVMAKITEEQQRKGNLGGPDLFLAPVGRLDENKISKHFCNNCEKDFEGSPKINFENPNEEVAENLILVEKGQYLCKKCDSTIAEYREFKKPDQEGDAGIAKPLSPESISKSELTPPPPMQHSFTPPTKPTFTPPPTQSNLQEEKPTIQPAQQKVQASKSSSFNSIVGLAVYDDSIKQIGIVKQMGVDENQNVVIVVTKSDGSNATYRWDQIKKVGEIVLLGSRDDSSGMMQGKSSKCQSCGIDNKVGSKFCENCGSPI